MGSKTTPVWPLRVNTQILFFTPWRHIFLDPLPPKSHFVTLGRRPPPTLEPQVFHGGPLGCWRTMKKISPAIRTWISLHLFKQNWVNNLIEMAAELRDGFCKLEYIVMSLRFDGASLRFACQRCMVAYNKSRHENIRINNFVSEMFKPSTSPLYSSPRFCVAIPSGAKFLIGGARAPPPPRP